LVTFGVRSALLLDFVEVDACDADRPGIAGASEEVVTRGRRRQHGDRGKNQWYPFHSV
jgi:hypothetical protein